MPGGLNYNFLKISLELVVLLLFFAETYFEEKVLFIPEAETDFMKKFVVP